MRVGYQDHTYPVLRTIYRRVPELNYVRVRNAHHIGLRLSNLKPGWVGSGSALPPGDQKRLFRDWGLNRVDLLHLSNTVSLGQTPWVASLETLLPRFQALLDRVTGDGQELPALVDDPLFRQALDALADDPCRGLIAWSACAADIQRELLGHYPAVAARIARKLTVLHPPQRPLVASFSAKGLPLDGPVRFMFVGNHFLRKGGGEVLDVFERAQAQYGRDLHLTVVSKLAPESYATAAAAGEIAAVRERLAQPRPWLDFYEGLANADVLRLMRAAHVGLLPTHADSYGFSVLEFQAHGCPVITTNVRALPEINNEAIGWVIEVPHNRFGEATYRNAAEAQALRASIREGLGRAIAEIMADRELIPVKGEAALRRLRADHSPEAYAQRLRQLYTAALGG